MHRWQILRVQPLFTLVLALAAAAPALAGQPFKLDRALSRIDIQVKATVDSFTAHLTDFETEIIYDAADGRVEQALFSFHFAALTTGKEERDRQMHAWQQTSQFPLARFKLTQLAPMADGRCRARGVLDFHGVERTVEFPIVIAGDHARLAIDGEARIDTRDFGLKVIRKFALLKVQPEVVVRFHLQGRLEEGEPVARGADEPRPGPALASAHQSPHPPAASAPPAAGERPDR